MGASRWRPSRWPWPADVGVTLDAADTPTLFGEDQGRYLIAPASFDKAEALMVAAGQAGVPSTNTAAGAASPEKGYHEIDASYHSGGGGGGQSGSFRVPKDPQTYAKLFIPEDRKND
jgi:hypothetical protein